MSFPLTNPCPKNWKILLLFSGSKVFRLVILNQPSNESWKRKLIMIQLKLGTFSALWLVTYFFFSRQQQILSQKKNLGKAFLPSDGDKRKKLPFYGQFFIHFQRLLDLVIIMGRLLVQATWKHFLLLQDRKVNRAKRKRIFIQILVKKGPVTGMLYFAQHNRFEKNRHQR